MSTVFLLINSCTATESINLQVMPKGKESEVCSIFRLMEVMCLELRGLSYIIGNESVPKNAKSPNGHRPLYQNFVFSRMLWSKLIGQRLVYM